MKHFPLVKEFISWSYHNLNKERYSRENFKSTFSKMHFLYNQPKQTKKERTFDEGTLSLQNVMFYLQGQIFKGFLLELHYYFVFPLFEMILSLPRNLGKLMWALKGEWSSFSLFFNLGQQGIFIQHTNNPNKGYMGRYWRLNLTVYLK